MYIIDMYEYINNPQVLKEVEKVFSSAIQELRTERGRYRYHVYICIERGRHINTYIENMNRYVCLHSIQIYVCFHTYIEYMHRYVWLHA